MKTIDIILIADKWCPTSRAYCLYLADAGYSFRKIMLVDFLGRSKLSKLCKVSCLREFLHSFLTKKRPSWPDYSAYKDYFEVFEENVELPINYLSEFCFSDYTNNLETLWAEDYDDHGFQKAILSQESKTFLYTNGGIVPSVLLKGDGVKFFHIHPGIVPDVRGSDGLLWSVFMRQKLGVSCFYMDSGIDTGELISQKEFELPKFNFKEKVCAQNEEDIYRALLIAYDPHLRASLFRDIVVAADGDGLHNLKTSSANNVNSESFLWMHSKLRLKAIRELTSDE